MRRILKAALSISLTLFVCGCVHKKVLDDIILVDGIGFDYSEQAEVKGTILFPLYLPDMSPENKTLTAEATIKKDILQDIQRQASDPIVTGSIEVVLFGKELASKKGILELIDAFQRDPSVGSGIHLAVVDGEAKELLEGEYGIRGNAPYISYLIKNNIKREDLPKTNLQLFLSSFHQKGKTPYMPQLKQIAKDRVELNGISLFKYGKMVDTVPPDKMFFFKLLADKYSHGQHDISIDEGEASIRDIRSSHNFELTKKDPNEVTIHIKVEGVIEEFSGSGLSSKKITKLKTKLEKEIEQECLNLIKHFQEKKIDPVGLGSFIQTQKRNFDVNKWLNSQYDELSVKVESDVKITETGSIE